MTSSRQRNEALKKLHNKEHSMGLRPSSFVVQARDSFRWTFGATMCVTIFGTAFAVALAYGRIIFPGLLVLVFLWKSCMPSRYVAFTPTDVTVWSQSIWNAAPAELLARHPRSAFVFRDAQNIQVGAVGPLKLGKEDGGILNVALHGLGPAPAPIPTTPPGPLVANVRPGTWG